MIPAQKLVHRAQTLAQELLAEAPGRAEEEEGEEREVEERGEVVREERARGVCRRVSVPREIAP